MVSSWVLQRVNDIHHFIGLSCDRFEGQFMALFAAIEASHNHTGWVSNSKAAFRSNRELKRLFCSINYNSTRVKGRGIWFIHEAQTIIMCRVIEIGPTQCSKP